MENYDASHAMQYELIASVTQDEMSTEDRSEDWGAGRRI